MRGGIALLNYLSNPRVKLIYTLILLGVSIYYFAGKIENLLRIVNQASIEMMGISLLLTFSVTLGSVYLAYYLYRVLGVQVSYPQVFRILNLALLGKYIPGKVWLIGNYVLFSHEVGIGSRKAGTNLVLFLSLYWLPGCLCCIPLITMFSASMKYILIFFLVVVGLLIHPKILNLVVSYSWSIVARFTGSKENNRFQLLTQISYWSYIKSIGLSFLLWVITGGVIFFIFLAFQFPIKISDLFVCILAAAASAVVGFLAIFAPDGIGVKEGVGVILLSQITTQESAFLVMITLRLLTILVDVCSGLISVTWLRPS